MPKTQYTLQKGEQFYPLEVSANYIKFYKYFLYVNPFLLVASLLLIKKYDKKFDKLIETDNKDKTNNEQDKKNQENELNMRMHDPAFWNDAKM